MIHLNFLNNFGGKTGRKPKETNTAYFSEDTVPDGLTVDHWSH